MRTQTPRLILRDFLADDFEFLLELSRNPEVSSTNDYLSADEAQLRAWLVDTLASEAKEPRQSHHSVIVLEANQQKIGWIGLQLSDDPNLGKVEFGYALSPQYWNRGLMTEAVRGMLAYCFEVLKVQLVTAFHLENNPSSGRVLLKSGMLPFEEAMREAAAGEAHFFVTAENWRVARRD